MGGGNGDGVYAVGDGVKAPVPVETPNPSFTDEAIRSRITGRVVLAGIVRRTGRVDSLKVVQSLGYGLDEEAERVVANQWRFKPALKDRHPVDCYVTIEVTFTLY